MHQKLAPDPFLILPNNPKQPVKVRYFERGLSKSFIKLTLFFLLNPVFFNGQSNQKQKGSGTSDQSLSKSRNIQKNSFIRYMLSDQV